MRVNAGDDRCGAVACNGSDHRDRREAGARVWRRGAAIDTNDDVGDHVNEVNLHRVRPVLGWVTVTLRATATTPPTRDDLLIGIMTSVTF